MIELIRSLGIEELPEEAQMIIIGMIVQESKRHDL